VVSPDNALATSINPSALGALDTWSLTGSYIDPLPDSAFADRLTSVYLASRLGQSFALGAGVDALRSRTPGLSSYNGFTLGAALNAGAAWSLGASWRLRAPRAGAAHAHTADVGLSFRPSPTLGFSLLGRDLAIDSPYLGRFKVRRSALLAATLRPLGDDRLFLELGGTVDQADDMGARFAAGIELPGIGRLSAAAELSQYDQREIWTFSGGLDVRWGGLSVAPALHTTKGFDEASWSLMADLHGKPRLGVPTQTYAVKIKVEGLSTRRLLSTVIALDQALHDPRVTAVVLETRDTAAGLAVAQELRLMIGALRNAGKPVYCHLESPSGSEYYLCSRATRVVLDPAGAVRLMGVASDSLYFGDVLRNIGVRADFVRIGRYKSAPEQYMNRGPSEFAAAQRNELLDDAYRRLTHDIADDLGRNAAQVRALIDKGPFAASEAVEHGLVATTVDLHDLESDAKGTLGSHTPLRERIATADHERFGPTGQIGVVVVDGTIVDGENVDVPFFDIHMSGGRTISRRIDELADDPRIRAIVLRIDSPGGAVTASDQIWRAVRRARDKKPVVASMGEVAASGGYYVASAANEIWASPSSITGSIGIFYGKVDIAPLAERFGIGIDSQKRGLHAGADTLYRPFTDEERAALVVKLRLWYRQFLERVALGRNMSVERVDALARGRVYSGDAAHENGLVDSLGGFGAALARARELARLKPNAEVVIVPRRPSTLLDYITGVGGSAQAGPGLALPLPDSLRPMVARWLLLSTLSGLEPVALYEGPLDVR
jgi:protease-4